MFHSATRDVSIALMKSQTPAAVLTQISMAPTLFISGTARLGSRSATRAWDSISSASISAPSRSDGVKFLGQQAFGRFGDDQQRILVCVEFTEQPPGRVLRMNLQTTRRMGVACVTTLLLGPPHDRCGPLRPAFVLRPLRTSPLG